MSKQTCPSCGKEYGIFSTGSLQKCPKCGTVQCPACSKKLFLSVACNACGHKGLENIR